MQKVESVWHFRISWVDARIFYFPIQIDKVASGRCYVTYAACYGKMVKEWARCFERVETDLMSSTVGVPRQLRDLGKFLGTEMRLEKGTAVLGIYNLVSGRSGFSRVTFCRF